MSDDQEVQTERVIVEYLTSPTIGGRKRRRRDVYSDGEKRVEQWEGGRWELVTGYDIGGVNAVVSGDSVREVLEEQ